MDRVEGVEWSIMRERMYGWGSMLRVAVKSRGDEVVMDRYLDQQEHCR